MRITEENFVSEMIVGDERALTYMIEKYGWIMKTVVKKHLYHLPYYEEDCINDILLAVWQHIDRFNPEVSTFKNWLAGVSKYTALNYLRKYKREIEQQSIEDIELTTEDLAYEEITREEIGRNFEQMLDCLKEKDKQLFVDLYIKEHSIEQVSQATGMRKDMIYNRVSRAKSKIRKLFS